MRRAGAAATALVLLAACGDDRDAPVAAEASTDAGRQFVAAWTAVTPEPLGSAVKCVDDQAGLLGEAELASLDPLVGPAQGEFLTAVFDDCLDDTQVTSFVTADILRSVEGMDDQAVGCLAPAMTDLLRQEGFASRFIEPDPSVHAEVETARLRCGVIGPSRKGEARFFGGLRSGELDLLTLGACPGAFTTESLSDLAARTTALDEDRRPTVFRLESAADAAPERWTTTVDGMDATLLITTGQFDDGTVCVSAVEAEPAAAAPYLVP